jgi:hypothetical protein
VNEGIEAGAKEHQVSRSLPFHCECGSRGCVETIEIPPARYESIVQERYHFVVIPGHEEPRIERVVARDRTSWSSRRPGRRGSKLTATTRSNTTIARLFRRPTSAVG